MRSKTAFVVVSSCLWYVAACGQQGSEQPEQMPSAETVVPDIPGVVAQATEIQVFEITSPGSSEGPVPLPDGSVVFAERAANRVWQIDTDDNVSLFVENTSGAMGMGLDPEGRLIVGQTLPPERPTIGVIYPEDQKAVLADTCDGRPLTRPNDLVVGRDGGVYFTDPGPTDAEIADGWVRRDPVVCYIPPGGSEAIQVADGIERPNGIQLSPDEKTLYVNNSYGEYLLAFDVEPDGTLSNRRDFRQVRASPRSRSRSRTGPGLGWTCR